METTSNSNNKKNPVQNEELNERLKAMLKDKDKRLEYLFKNEPQTVNKVLDKITNTPLDYSRSDYGLSAPEYYRRFGKYYEEQEKLQQEERDKKNKAIQKEKEYKDSIKSERKEILVYVFLFIGILLIIGVIGQAFDKAGMGGIFRLFFPGE